MDEDAKGPEDSHSTWAFHLTKIQPSSSQQDQAADKQPETIEAQQGPAADKQPEPIELQGQPALIESMAV